MAVRQVVIEARIVEASDSLGKASAFRLGGADLGVSVAATQGILLAAAPEWLWVVLRRSGELTGYFGASESGAMSNL